MERAELERLKELERKATSKVWCAWTHDGGLATQGPPHGNIIGPQRVYIDRSVHYAPDDALLMAAARNALPDLLSEVERLNQTFQVGVNDALVMEVERLTRENEELKRPKRCHEDLERFYEDNDE